jgi:signal transduction histidine kinase
MDIKFPKNIFHSARLKLTLFYLIIVLFFSIFSTLTYRWMAQKAFRSGNSAQVNAIQNLYFRDFRSFSPFRFTPSGDDIAVIQNAQEQQTRQRLDEDVLIINLMALIVGGALSWWFAGRTLYPIEEAHESQKRFASDASHELRTPLANMKVENEVFLRQKQFTAAEAKLLIESNLEEVQRLENLSKSLLSMTQFENVELRFSQFELEKLVDKTLSTIDKVAEGKKINIKSDITPQRIIGDEGSLVQLLSIVLDNAIKYSPEKSEVLISGQKKGSHYHLRIRDHGNGIKPSDLPYIFDRFYRGDKARKSNGGYGLGLSLAREIASANNSRITATNVKGNGAEFTIILNSVK